jgi:hypothetical protein
VLKLNFRLALMFKFIINKIDNSVKLAFLPETQKSISGQREHNLVEEIDWLQRKRSAFKMHSVVWKSCNRKRDEDEDDMYATEAKRYKLK